MSDIEMLRRWVAMSRKRRSFAMHIPLGEMEPLLDELETLRRGYAGLADELGKLWPEVERLRQVEHEWKRLIWHGLENWQFGTYPELEKIARTVRSDPDAALESRDV